MKQSLSSYSTSGSTGDSVKGTSNCADSEECDSLLSGNCCERLPHENKSVKPNSKKDDKTSDTSCAVIPHNDYFSHSEACDWDTEYESDSINREKTHFNSAKQQIPFKSLLKNNSNSDYVRDECCDSSLSTPRSSEPEVDRRGKSILSGAPLPLIARLLAAQKLKHFVAFNSKDGSERFPSKQQVDKLQIGTNGSTTFNTPDKDPQNPFEFQLLILLLCISLVYGAQNLLAPNMSLIATEFKFNNIQRDQLIGGELTFLFYTPGTLGAIFVGLVSGIFSRKNTFSAVICFTSVACFLTSLVGNFSELAIVRTITGLGIGGVVPLGYSLIGDWYPPHKRATASAFLMGACGVGAFVGQCIAAGLGGVQWRIPFLIISIPSLIMGALFPILTAAYGTESEESQCNQERLSIKGIKNMFATPTNLLMLIQAFPGNIPWGVLVIYLHDFLRADLGMPNANALAAISCLAFFSFIGMICGGFMAEKLYKVDRRILCLACAAFNFLRLIPFLLLFQYPEFTSASNNSLLHVPFVALLIISGFLSTVTVPNMGAIILNTNPPEVRCAIFGLFTVLDDFSKAVGSLLVPLAISCLGTRRLALQIIMCLWLITTGTMFFASWTYPRDEDRNEERMEKRMPFGCPHDILEATPIVARPHLHSAMSCCSTDDLEFGIIDRSVSRL